MMAKTEDPGVARPVSLTFALLSVLLTVVLGHVVLFALVRLDAMARVLAGANLLWGPVHWQTTGMLGAYLLLGAGAIAGVIWLRPWGVIVAMSREARGGDGPEDLKPAVMSILLGLLALAGLSAAAGVVGAVLYDPRIKHPVNWLSWAYFALYLLIGLGAIWALVRLKPWTRREPMSPSTRKTNALFGLGGILATVSCLAVIVHTMQGGGNAFAFFSNSPVAPWVAVFAIATWLLSWAISWLWYFSADEHEQRASDVGLLFGGLAFAVVTPAWWVAARAGLMPQPNAMALWLAVNLIWTGGWLWRRNR